MHSLIEHPSIGGQEKGKGPKEENSYNNKNKIIKLFKVL